MIGPAVVGLGGGHGLAVTLQAFRRYAGEITAVVSVADDGGSSGRIRRDFGIPAPGDLRRCLATLAAEPDGPWARAFGLRFASGDVEGHVLGNLVLAALTETCGSFDRALREASSLLGVTGQVLPATAAPVTLVGETAVGPLHGQTTVEEHGGAVTAVTLHPADAPPAPGVVEAIETADQVVVGPGSLFTSVLAVVTVPAIRAALARRSVVYVCNLQPSKETPGFTVGDHVDALIRHGLTPAHVVADLARIDAGPVPEGVTLWADDLASPDGWAHDPARLAATLASL